MDACFGYLREVDILMEGYTELPLYQDIFEVADPEVAEATGKNAEIEEKSLNLMQKAINVVKNIFNNIKEIIRTIFTWLGKSKEEKAAYSDFVKKCKENPEFAKMKVTIHDYTDINRAYEKTLSECEKEYKQIKDEEEEVRPTLKKKLMAGLEKAKESTKRIVAATGSAMTVEAVLNYASACKENAARVEFMMDFDMGLLDELEKQLGQKEIRKFKKKVHALNSRIGFVRQLAGGRQEQSLTLKDSVKEVLQSVKEPYSAVWKVKNAVDETTSERNIKAEKMHKRIHDAAVNKDSVASGDFKAIKRTKQKLIGAGLKLGVDVGKSTLAKRKFAKKAYKDQMKNEKKIINRAHEEVLKENEKYSNKD